MAWYERLIDPLPNDPVVRPPDTVTGFYLHFIWPVRWLILAVLLLSLASSLIEMSLFVFLGWVVDWVNETPPAEFFAQHGWHLAIMGAVVWLVWTPGRPVARHRKPS